MYIETRFYDDGKAMAKLHKGFGYPKLDGDPTKCDCYLSTINPHSEMKLGKVQYLQDDSGDKYDYESLEEWLEEMFVEIEDIRLIIIALESGEMVDITKYC